MNPFTHWVDIDLDPALRNLSLILAGVGAAYFAFQLWRVKRRREKSAPKSD
jgi:hypothetical protein